jgi:nucleotide-binding universal stress UspA family protein
VTDRRRDKPLRCSMIAATKQQREQPGMSEGPDFGVPPIRSVLHATDFTVSSELAFAHALKIALAGKTKLYVLHADPSSDDEVDWSEFPGVRRTLAKWGVLPEGSSTADVGDKLGIHLAKVSARERNPVRAIVRFADDHKSDLIVLATHGREGLPRWLHGSVAEPAARAVDAPTLFIARGARGFIDPDSGAVHLRNVLIPVDHRPSPHAAVREAKRLCRTLAAPETALHLLHVGEPGDMPALEVETTPPFMLTRAARSGDVVGEILAAAAECQADLIAMATAGHQGFLDAMRGSTTERVLRHAPCPVLAAPAGQGAT